jgi:hypothetical protein
LICTCKNINRQDAFFLFRIDTLATTFNGAEGVEFHQIGTDNTLGTSDMSTSINALRALEGFFSSHNLATGAAAVRSNPSFRRMPKFIILRAILNWALRGLISSIRCLYVK